MNGRTASDQAVIATYLTLLETPLKRGRKKNPDKLRSRIEEVEAELEEAAPLRKLVLHQQLLDLQEELTELENGGSLTREQKDEAEAAFIEVAAAYGEKKGLTAGAWRAAGVPVRVLKQAGIS
jgi:hypothetical protein